MLFRQEFLDGIQAGQITLAFRRWQRPTVKTGGTLKTPIGILSILSVEPVDPNDISEREAKQAGYGSTTTLIQELGKRDGRVYKIKLRFAEADPRIVLRQTDQLTADDIADVIASLRRLDAASHIGAWTTAVLQAINVNPGVPARQLADQLGFEKEWLKVNVRKLKNLGLAISLGTGYRISPRGNVILQHLESAKSK